MRKHIKTVVVIVLLISSAIGLHYFRGFSRVLSLFRKEASARSKPFQPAAALLTQPAAPTAVKLYFPSLSTPGKLEEESSEIRASELDQNRAKQIILKLIEGSKKNNGRTISQEAVLREMFLSPDGTAFIDFSGDLQKNHPGGIECELQTIYSIVNSLTVNILSIKRVRFLIDDAEVETLMGHSNLRQAFTQNLDYVSRPISRATPAEGQNASTGRRISNAQ